MIKITSIAIIYLKQNYNQKLWVIISYLKLDLVTLEFSVFMERAFHCAVLAISSDMFTTEGSTLDNKHTLISTQCLATALIMCHAVCIIWALGYLFTQPPEACLIQGGY